MNVGVPFRNSLQESSHVACWVFDLELTLRFCCPAYSLIEWCYVWLGSWKTEVGVVHFQDLDVRTCFCQGMTCLPVESQVGS